MKAAAPTQTSSKNDHIRPQPPLPKYFQAYLKN